MMGACPGRSACSQALRQALFGPGSLQCGDLWLWSRPGFGPRRCHSLVGCLWLVGSLLRASLPYLEVRRFGVAVAGTYVNMWGCC